MSTSADPPKLRPLTHVELEDLVVRGIALRLGPDPATGQQLYVLRDQAEALCAVCPDLPATCPRCPLDA